MLICEGYALMLCEGHGMWKAMVGWYVHVHDMMVYEYHSVMVYEYHSMMVYVNTTI